MAEEENKVAEVKKEQPEAKAESSSRMAVVLVRGLVGVKKPVKDTLTLLKLWKKNQCVVVNSNPVIKGMLQKVKDYITWGEINEETWKELVEKRGKEYKGRLTDSKGKYKYKVLEVQGKKYQHYFNLNPPRKGFGRKGIKVPFKVGGALGYRGEKMDDLLKRML